LSKTVDDRSPIAKSLSKVSEIIAICMLMIVPGLIGYLIDQQVGSRIVFTLLGLVFGMTGAVMQLVRLVSVTNTPSQDSSDPDESSQQE
jgi:F0F1-type ATP synthase assembly protein I